MHYLVYFNDKLKLTFKITFNRIRCMGKQLTCEKCGEVIDGDKEKVHKIFCYAWVDGEHN